MQDSILWRHFVQVSQGWGSRIQHRQRRETKHQPSHRQLAYLIKLINKICPKICAHQFFGWFGGIWIPDLTGTLCTNRGWTNWRRGPTSEGLFDTCQAPWLVAIRRHAYAVSRHRDRRAKKDREERRKEKKKGATSTTAQTPYFFPLRLFFPKWVDVATAAAYPFHFAARRARKIQKWRKKLGRHTPRLRPRPSG